MKLPQFRQPWYLFVFIFAVVLASTGFSFTPGSPPTRWIGDYVCAQGKTDLELTITPQESGNLLGIFHFQHVPSGAKGRFYLNGVFNSQTNRLKFTPGEWIEQPYMYRTVGMDGTVSQVPARYEGNIDVPGCTNFKVDLVE